MTKSIPLTQKQFALVDDEDFEYINQWKWYAMWRKDTNSFYAARNSGQWPKRTKIDMARQVMNTPDDLECDHINHETLNNQKYNLRNVTHGENILNRRTRKDNLLSQKCISSHYGHYQVRINLNGKRVFDKTYNTLIEAIKSRDENLKKYHGIFSD